ncbi:amidohydrolase family protein [Chitinophaga horti]|uniref:Amidohydrolase family protein n=1 Tax=Chitinophaga horti TaxID=2920382 RepID=A0ABY6J370_9BACT|nr:amidohydrolase family protein [Chitinophaga horti]UYQ93826.1 amidohydrolase family protein [Chitinophaga horti]
MLNLRLTITFLLFAHAVVAQTTLIKAGRFYDAEKNVFLDKQEILIEGGKVKAVGTKLEAPANARVLDYPNSTVTPGLIDAHTHILLQQRTSENLAIDGLMNSPERRVLRAAGFAQAYLNAGFTTIRDLGNSGEYLDLEVSVAIRRGYIPGPRMLCSGPILSAVDGQFYQLPYSKYDDITAGEYRVINGPEDAVRAVKEHINAGVDVIKIVAWGERLGLSREEMAAIVKTAHDYGSTVTAHASGTKVMYDAIMAGVDGIEHGYGMADSILTLMAKKKVYLVPTDVSLRSAIAMTKGMHRPVDTAAIREELKPLGERLMRAHKAGVMIVAGSDAYFEQETPRGHNAKETIAAYVEEGLPVKDALRAATWNAAKAFGREGRLGVIKAGADADIAIFNGDLEKDFARTLFDVQLVLKNGQIVAGGDK